MMTAVTKWTKTNGSAGDALSYCVDYAAVLKTKQVCCHSRLRRAHHHLLRTQPVAGCTPTDIRCLHAACPPDRRLPIDVLQEGSSAAAY